MNSGFATGFLYYVSVALGAAAAVFALKLARFAFWLVRRAYRRITYRLCLWHIWDIHRGPQSHLKNVHPRCWRWNLPRMALCEKHAQESERMRLADEDERYSRFASQVGHV
jgi:hypothetical protein